MKLVDHHYFVRDLEKNYPLVVKGEGCWLWDQDGKKYLDGCSGANVTGIGHGVIDVANAMHEQAKKIAYAPPLHFLHEATLELAQKLTENAPKGFSRAMLLSGGSEAMENAFKIARQFHMLNEQFSKYRIVSRWQGFHGNTLAADAVSGKTNRRTVQMPMLMGVPHIVPANCYRCEFKKTYPDCGILCALDLERTIIQEGPEYISAFACETVVGAAAAAVTPVKEYYPMIRRICDEHNVLWIADEIMSGVWRTGKFAAVEHWGVSPDLIVLAKGLSSGYIPLAAILINDRVFSAFEKTKTPYVGGHTYNAHPITSSVGVAVLDYIKKNKLDGRATQMEPVMALGLKAVADRNPIVGDIRGKGLMWGMEFVRDKESKEPFSVKENVCGQVVFKAQSKGLIIYPVNGCADGKRGDGVLICPPLIINETEADFLFQTLDEVLMEVSHELGIH